IFSAAPSAVAFLSPGKRRRPDDYAQVHRSSTAAAVIEAAHDTHHRQEDNAQAPLMTAFLDRLLNLPAGIVYLLVGALVFAEDALFVGFVLPGETAAILGGVAASLGHVSLTLITVTVVVAAIVG